MKEQIQKKIRERLDESSNFKSQLAKNLGLKHVGYGSYKDNKGDVYRWSVFKNKFVKSHGANYEPNRQDAKDVEYLANQMDITFDSGTYLDIAKNVMKKYGVISDEYIKKEIRNYDKELEKDAAAMWKLEKRGNEYFDKTKGNYWKWNSSLSKMELLDK